MKNVLNENVEGGGGENEGENEETGNFLKMG